ncbi:MAG: extracellular solute-binding protein [Hyphomicrobiaceae bacterium]
MAVRRIWTHEEIKAAADGNFELLSTLNRRHLLQGGAAIAGALALGPFIPGTARADIGGEVSLFTWEGFDMEPELKEWREKNGVTAKNSTMTTQDDVQGKLVGGSPVALDLTEYNQAYNKFYAEELGIIEPIDVSKVPNYNANDIFAGFYQGERWYWNNTQWGIPFTWGLNSLVYNPAMMERPTSYADLLKPELKGKITIIDDNTGTWPTAAIMGGVPGKYPNVTKEELATLWEGMKPYRDQCKSFAASNGDVISMLVSGDIAACLNVWSGIPFETAKQNVKTDYVIPKEGAVMWCDAWFTPKTAKNRDTALAYINETLAAAPQASLANRAVTGVVTKGAVPLLDEATRALFDYNDLDSVFKSAPMLGIPPRESTEFATYDEWVRAYEDFKTGI